MVFWAVLTVATVAYGFVEAVHIYRTRPKMVFDHRTRRWVTQRSLIKRRQRSPFPVSHVKRTDTDTDTDRHLILVKDRAS